MSAEKIESELDKKINKYNKYSDTHPMMGINYDKSNKNYKVRYETIKMNAKTIDVACEKIKECILSKYGEYDLIHQSMFKRKKFINDDKMIVGYIIFNEIFFDIQHVLIFLGFGESRAQQIYLSNKENITYRFLHANVYGGYIIRELICITSIKKILHDSNKRKSVTLSKLIGMEIINTKKPTKENSTIDSIITVFHKEEYMEQYSILGYYIDLYFHTHKIAIECDEKGHVDRDLKYEKKREHDIQKELGCKFIRYNPDCPKFSILKVISDIHYEMESHYE